MEKSFEQELAEYTQIAPESLTDYQKGFIRARAAYLTEEQLAVFAEVLGTTVSEPTLEELTKAELQAKLTEAGIEFDPSAKKADLVALLQPQE